MLFDNYNTTIDRNRFKPVQAHKTENAQSALVRTLSSGLRCVQHPGRMGARTRRHCPFPLTVWIVLLIRPPYEAANGTHTMTDDNEEHASHPAFWRSRYGAGLIVIGGVAVFFLLTQHRAHFLGALPFLLILACPLMHLFMHHGHDKGKHRSSDHGRGRDANKRPQDKLP